MKGHLIPWNDHVDTTNDPGGKRVWRPYNRSYCRICGVSRAEVYSICKEGLDQDHVRCRRRVLSGCEGSGVLIRKPGGARRVEWIYE